MLHCSVPTLIPHVKRYAVESFHPHKCTLHILVYAVIWRSQNACISSSVPHKLCVSVHVSLTNCVYLFICRSQIACICSSVAHKFRVYVPVAHKLFVSVHLLPTNCVHLFIYRSRNVRSVAHKLRVPAPISLTRSPFYRSQIAFTCLSVAHKKSSLSLTNCVYLFICHSQMPVYVQKPRWQWPLSSACWPAYPATSHPAYKTTGIVVVFSRNTGFVCFVKRRKIRPDSTFVTYVKYILPGTKIPFSRINFFCFSYTVLLLNTLPTVGSYT